MPTPAALSWHSVASSGVYLMRHRERRTCKESISFSPCHVIWVLGKCPKYFREEYAEEISNLLKDMKPFRGVQLDVKISVVLNSAGIYNPKRKPVCQDYTRLS